MALELELQPQARTAPDCETLAHMPLRTLLYHVLTQSLTFTPAHRLSSAPSSPQ